MRRFVRYLIFWVLSGIVFCYGEETSGYISLLIENDTIYKTDGQYTHGMQLAWTRFRRPAFILNRWSESLLTHLNHDDVRQTSTSWSAGQILFTPDSIKESRLIPEDRSYAGCLFITGTVYQRFASVSQSFGWTVGIVGPHSYGGGFQDWVHHRCDWPIPRGWKHQLKDEPIVNLTYRRQWRVESRPLLIPFQCKPNAGGKLGTDQTGFLGGIEISCGNTDFMSATIFPESGGSSDGWLASSPFRVQAFGRVNGAWMIHDMFLDGSLFRGGHSVKKKPVRFTASAGLSVGVGGFTFGYTHVFQSKQFNGQTRDHRFAVIEAGWGVE